MLALFLPKLSSFQFCHQAFVLPLQHTLGAQNYEFHCVDICIYTRLRAFDLFWSVTGLSMELGECHGCDGVFHHHHHCWWCCLFPVFPVKYYHHFLLMKLHKLVPCNLSLNRSLFLRSLIITYRSSCICFWNCQSQLDHGYCYYQFSLTSISLFHSALGTNVVLSLFHWGMVLGLHAEMIVYQDIAILLFGKT